MHTSTCLLHEFTLLDIGLFDDFSIVLYCFNASILKWFNHSGYYLYHVLVGVISNSLRFKAHIFPVVRADHVFLSAMVYRTFTCSWNQLVGTVHSAVHH